MSHSKPLFKEKGQSKLPKEAVKFAQSMGLDLKGLEPEAEEMWKMLDDMSKNDPAGYESFVAQQLKEGKEDGGGGESKSRSLRPDGMLHVGTCYSCSVVVNFVKSIVS